MTNIVQSEIPWKNPGQENISSHMSRSWTHAHLHEYFIIFLRLADDAMLLLHISLAQLPGGDIESTSLSATRRVNEERA